MKNIGSTMAGHDFADPRGETDWKRVSAMTEEEIHEGALSDPDAQPLPLPGRDWTGLTPLPNTKRLRERLGMTQDEFAGIYRIPVGTLRDWEQRRKHPDATARAYLIVIDRDPKAVAALLNAA
jgi:putative transcriptional regulator